MDGMRMRMNCVKTPPTLKRQEYWKKQGNKTHGIKSAMPKNAGLEQDLCKRGKMGYPGAVLGGLEESVYLPGLVEEQVSVQGVEIGQGYSRQRTI